MLLLLLGLEMVVARYEVVATRAQGIRKNVMGVAMVDSSMVVTTSDEATIYENLGNRTWAVIDTLRPPNGSFHGAVAMGRVNTWTLWAAMAGDDGIAIYQTDDYGNVNSGWDFLQMIPGGSSLAASEGTLVVGIDGTVTVYEIGWRRVTYRQEFNGPSGFGTAVAVKGTTVVVSDLDTVWIYQDYEQTQVLSRSWWRPRLKWCASGFGASLALAQHTPYLAIGCGGENGTTAILRTHDNGASWGLDQELRPRPTSAIAFGGSSDKNLIITGTDGVSFFRKGDDFFGRSLDEWTFVQDLRQDEGQLASSESQFVLTDDEILHAYNFETCDDFLVTGDTNYTLTASNEYVWGWSFPGRDIDVPKDNYLCLRDGCYTVHIVNASYSVTIKFGSFQHTYVGGEIPYEIEFQFIVADGWTYTTDGLFGSSSSCSRSAPAPTSFPTVLATPKNKKNKKKSRLAGGGVIAGIVIASALAILLIVGLLVSRRRRDFAATTAPTTTEKALPQDVVVVQTTSEVEMN